MIEWFKNEFYPKIMQIDFQNRESIYYYCGEVEEFDDSIEKFKLIAGRDSGIIFFDSDTFSKYRLDKVHSIENYLLQQKNIGLAESTHYK